MPLEFNGYRVITASNRVEALAAANIERPGVIVSAQARIFAVMIFLNQKLREAGWRLKVYGSDVL